MTSIIRTLVSLCVFGAFLGFGAPALASPTPHQKNTVADYSPWGNWLTRFSTCSLHDVKIDLCTSRGVCLTKPQDARLKMVVLGVGTQNYTCGTTAPGATYATPTAFGAMAKLYDISCMAATDPTAMHYLPKLQMLASTQASTLGGGDIESGFGFPLVGIHDFAPDEKTPCFDVKNPWGRNEKLKFVGRKLEGIPAPADAMNASADWLKLGTAEGKLSKASKGIKYIYRIHVAGGKPPSALCKGYRAGAEVTVDYATQYWIYG